MKKNIMKNLKITNTTSEKQSLKDLQNINKRLNENYFKICTALNVPPDIGLDIVLRIIANLKLTKK